MMAFVKALLAALGACAAAAPLRAPTDKPNVVLIYADDLGFGDPGFNGHPTNDSPHIDGLRARGKRITTWYSGCPVCTGSRASLMTGRVFSRVGVPGVFGGTSQTGLPLSEVTLADQFKKAGYATGAVGKRHLGQREMYLPRRAASTSTSASRSPTTWARAATRPAARAASRARLSAASAASARPRPRPSTPRRRRRAFAAAAAPWQRHAAPWEAYARTATRRTRRARGGRGRRRPGGQLPAARRAAARRVAEADDARRSRRASSSSRSTSRRSRRSTRASRRATRAGRG